MKYEEIKTPKELYSYMKENIEYGFVNQNNEILLRKEKSEIYYMEELLRNYKFQSPEEVIMSKCGLCYDQNELMRYWLESNGYDVKTYFSPIRNHSILVYLDNNKYNWIERTFKDVVGIHDFNNLEDLFNFYLYIQDSEHVSTNIYEYDIKDYGCNFYDFVSTAKESKLVLKK